MHNYCPSICLQKKLRLYLKTSVSSEAVFSADEQNYILQLGEADIRADVPNLGILEDAENNAKEVFTAMLQQLNYNDINIQFE